MSEIRSQYRFFLDSSSFGDNEVSFPEPVAHQLTRVLRLRSGAEVVALDGEGQEFHVVLDVGDKAVRGQITRVATNQAEPRCRIHLFQAIPKARKLETVLRQCTELGVSEFTPIFSERAGQEGGTKQRQRRLHEVVREAAEQCGRGRLPRVNEAERLTDVLARKQYGVFFSNEDQPQPSSPRVLLRNATDRSQLVSIFVGPEGGFSPGERAQARELGLSIVSLGPRTFRVDTAAVVACAMIFRESGDI